MSGTEQRVTIGPTQQTPEQIQAEVMIFADRYWSVVAQVLDEARRAATTPQRRLGAQTLKIVSVESAIRIATHPNPIVALLDMTVMVTLMREVWDDHWAPNVYREAPGGPIATAFADLEEEIWTIAERILTDAELAALRNLIAEMRTAYPDQVYVVNLRASEFAAERERSIGQAPGAASLLALFALDPLASLAPTTRELERSRLLAERAFFYTTRLPGLMSWRADRALLFAAAMPEVEEARTKAEELQQTADRFGAFAETLVPEMERQRVETIDQLFDRLRAERSGAVNEVFDRLAGEREAVFETLQSSGTEVSTFLGTLDETTNSATTLSDSLRETITEARLLTRAIGEFRSGDDGGRPFDIREYESVSRSATVTVQELTTLVGSLNDLLRAPQWSERSDDAANAIGHATVASSQLLNRAFGLAFALVGFTVVIVFLAALTYRALALRMAQRNRAASASSRS